jgi:hypothetical protein
MSGTLVIISLVSILVFWEVFFGNRLPEQYRERGCQGRPWRRTFPSASKQDIREFLSIVVSAFGFAEVDRLKLGPTDTLWGIYRTLYPASSLCDDCELEDLEISVNYHYGVKLRDIWREDLTLGELFANSTNPTNP